MKKSLITGGAGFIGSHIADELIKNGHEVHVIDNLSSGTKDNIHPDVKFHLMDINDHEIHKIFEDIHFNYVFHHAAQLDVRKSVSDPKFDVQENIIGTINLLQASIHNKVEKFIFASSGGTVYGEQIHFPADEKHPTQPLSPYGISKLTMEYYLHYYHTYYHLPYVALRYGNIYGPRQSPHGEAGVIAIFTNKMLADEQVFINGDGFQTRDYVFIEDVVQANILALNDNIHACYNIGTGIETDVNQIFNTLNQFIDYSKEVIHGPPKYGEQQRSVLSFDKYQKESGWMPKVDFSSGISKTVEWFKQIK